MNMDEITEDDLRQIFMRLDNGSKGYLDEADLASLVSTSEQHQQEDAEITRLMDQLDADKDGRVNNITFSYKVVSIKLYNENAYTTTSSCLN